MAGGEIWYQIAGKSLQRYPHDADRLVTEYWLQRAGSVRVPAVPDNADLLNLLYVLQGVGQPKRIWLMPPFLSRSACGPVGAINHDALTMKPSELARELFALDSGLPPSLGGSRRSNWADSIVSMLARNLQLEPDCLQTLSPRGKECIALARCHPAWPALSYPTDYDSTAAIDLLVCLADPRWYIDPAHPDRSKRLHSAFGLGRECESNLRGLLFQGEKVGRNAWATRQVLTAWGCGPNYTKPQQAAASEDFLRRIYYGTRDGSGQSAHDCRVAGARRACRVFLKFVCDVWLDNLTEPRVYEEVIAAGRSEESGRHSRLRPTQSYSPQLFVPSHLFHGEEFLSWERHLTDWRSRTTYRV